MSTSHSDNVYKPSAKQTKALKMIKDVLGLTCKGKTFEEVSTFLDEHLSEAVKNLQNRKPSDKQLAMIKQIEKALDVKWEGSTISEASAFLNEYLPQFKKTWYQKKPGSRVKK